MLIEFGFVLSCDYMVGEDGAKVGEMEMEVDIHNREWSKVD